VVELSGGLTLEWKSMANFDGLRSALCVLNLKEAWMKNKTVRDFPYPLAAADQDQCLLYSIADRSRRFWFFYERLLAVEYVYQQNEVKKMLSEHKLGNAGLVYERCGEHDVGALRVSPDLVLFFGIAQSPIALVGRVIYIDGRWFAAYEKAVKDILVELEGNDKF
jgi:hypothetical protein